MTEPVVRVRDLEVRLDARPVLHGVDLQVSPGELVTVLGANGSGKSTLIRTVVGLVRPAAGTVEVFGTPITRFRSWSRLGYVPQRTASAAAVPATVREVVSTGTLAARRLFAPLGAGRRAAIDAAMRRTGVNDLASRPVTELSGGQHQRVLIARALAGGAELLVMDEPTAGVDKEHTQELADLLGSLRDDGTAILLVAHDLGPMEPYIDRAVVIEDGRVVFEGPVAELDEDHHHDHPHHDHDLHPGETVGAPSVVPALGLAGGGAGPRAADSTGGGAGPRAASSTGEDVR